MRHLRKLSICIIFVFLTACSDDNIAVKDSQEVYFEVATTTHAWEHKYEGFLINEAGEIRQYTDPETWISADTIIDQISVSDMKANLGKTVASQKKIDEATLQRYIAKIENLTQNQYSKVKLTEADPVSKTFYAYRFNEKRAVYESILIFENSGNSGRLNSDPNAVEIYNWLKDISRM